MKDARSCAIALLAVASSAVLLAQSPAWTVASGDIRIVCPMTIGGSFEARTRSIAGSLRSPVTANDPYVGQLAVDLATLDTGIGLRNNHLRGTYLEIGKGDAYAVAVLSNIRAAGFDPTADAARGRFTGTLRLHGAEKTISGQVETRRKGAALHVTATFPLVLADFGIAKPRYLGVGVKDEVLVRVTFDASPSTEAQS